MGQSLVQNYIHIIFSTKFRKPYINSKIESELHAYIGGVCNELDSQVIAVGGYTEHIHILCMLSKKIALMELVQKVKANSSRWIKSKGSAFRDFSWQNGYAVFSVRPVETERLVNYIKNQHEHHRIKNFKQEYMEFLKDYQSDFNEKYIWE